MVRRTAARLALCVAMPLLVASSNLLPATPAHGQGFFPFFFGGSFRPPPAPPAYQMPFDERPRPEREAPRRRAGYGDAKAWCVRGCDGRYFPVSGADRESRAKTCNSLCPASDTRLVYGSDIEAARTEIGEPYSELPNAFRYRKELVAGCTCNGKDQIGLARVNIEDDPTLHSGDIVADRSGLVVANRSSGRHGATLNFTPIPEKLRSRFRHVPVVAKE